MTNYLITGGAGINLNHELITGVGENMGYNQHDEKGRFKRKHQHWSLYNFNDGYVGAKGRFRVYYPEHPRSNKVSGRVLRSVVAYEAYHDVSLDDIYGYNIHHKNGNKVDDSKDNLELLTSSEHQIRHARERGAYIEKVCECCGNTFEMTRGRANDKGANRGRFCGQSCYHQFRRENKTEFSKVMTYYNRGK